MVFIQPKISSMRLVDEVPRIVALVGSERPWLKASAA
jgi:hypothetical protein